jgi:hypothetical protein
MIINRLFDNLPLCLRHDYYPKKFYNLPKNFFLFILTTCVIPKKNIQKRKPTQQLLKKKQ